MRFNSINPLSDFTNTPVQFFKYKFGTEDIEPDEEKLKKGQRPQRPEHEKDEAFEEFIEKNPNAKPQRKSNEPDEDEIGRTEKAEKQPTDERDRYKDQ